MSELFSNRLSYPIQIRPLCVGKVTDNQQYFVFLPLPHAYSLGRWG